MTKRMEVSGTAFVMSAGMLDQKDAKTTHGLIRGSERFQTLAVIDDKFAGQDAGMVLDGKEKGIPIYPSFAAASEALGLPQYLVIGVATVGGVLPKQFLTTIRMALEKGVSVVNGLHDYLQDHPDLLALAQKSGAQLVDIRKPKKFEDLSFWSEAIYQVDCPIIAVLGMDCAVGKRTTARFIKEACTKNNLNAEMIFTGQTGWMQGAKYGFIFDSTLNDFVSGELSNAIIAAHKNEALDYILLEGQSSLRNPSGPCGAEYLISGNAKHVVLVHEVKKKYFDDHESWGLIPSVESEIALIKAYGSEVIALSLNTSGCSLVEAKAAQQALSKDLGIPVFLPLEEGVEGIIPVLKKLKQ
jgi:uncharacterized NAD-dependent epimerase/dehydratase family protein